MVGWLKLGGAQYIPEFICNISNICSAIAACYTKR